jgi:hypothetical protein
MKFSKNDNVEIVNENSGMFRQNGKIIEVLSKNPSMEGYTILVDGGFGQLYFRPDELAHYTPDNGEDPERFDPI